MRRVTFSPQPAIHRGMPFAGLPSMGYANINDIFAPCVLRELGSFIEDHGYEAVLFQNTAVRYGCASGKAVAVMAAAPYTQPQMTT